MAPATPSSAASGTPSSRRARKQCSSAGCSRVDAGGGFCVAHGGGKKCSFPGCVKGYQTGGFCRKHGGGARCHVPGCAKVDAGRGLCRAHGGGKRCQSSGCPKADVGGGFCTAHGGGKRCSEPGCTKIDQGGGKCRAHGGAKRCKKPACGQPARGATGFCPDHGGARVCSTANCRRLARSSGDGALCGLCAKEKLSPIDLPHGEKPLALVLAAEQVAKTSGEWTAAATEDVDCRVELANRPFLGELGDVGTPKPAFANDNSSLDAPCGGSQVANCLDNGCSRSYGGRCNCLGTCTCNHSSPTSSTSMMLGQVTALSITDANTGQRGERAPCGGIKRTLLQVQLLGKAAASGLPVGTVVSMIAALPVVRSTHALPDSSSPSTADESGSCLVVARTNASVSLRSSLSSVVNLGLCRVDILDESDLEWARKEIVLTVEGMMCPGNCGATVMTAVHAVEKVEWAELAFEARQVAVRGEMHVDDLREAITAVGFEVAAAEVTPLARQFRLRVAELALSSRGEALKQALVLVEGVEELVLLVESSEILVGATLADSSTLISAAMRAGFTLFDVSDDREISKPSSQPQLGWSPRFGPSGFVSSSSPMGPASIDRDPSHTCDMDECPQNSCPRYMMTVAHTAALAIGWAVPGCGMSNGRECTCGDACKCKGCPEHNPAT